MHDSANTRKHSIISSNSYGDEQTRLANYICNDYKSAPECSEKIILLFIKIDLFEKQNIRFGEENDLYINKLTEIENLKKALKSENREHKDLIDDIEKNIFDSARTELIQLYLKLVPFNVNELKKQINKNKDKDLTIDYVDSIFKIEINSENEKSKSVEASTVLSKGKKAPQKLSVTKAMEDCIRDYAVKLEKLLLHCWKQDMVELFNYKYNDFKYLYDKFVFCREGLESQKSDQELKLIIRDMYKEEFIKLNTFKEENYIPTEEDCRIMIKKFDKQEALEENVIPGVWIEEFNFQKRVNDWIHIINQKCFIDVENYIKIISLCRPLIIKSEQLSAWIKKILLEDCFNSIENQKYTNTYHILNILNILKEHIDKDLTKQAKGFFSKYFNERAPKILKNQNRNEIANAQKVFIEFKKVLLLPPVDSLFGFESLCKNYCDRLVVEAAQVYIECEIKANILLEKNKITKEMMDCIASMKVLKEIQNLENNTRGNSEFSKFLEGILKKFQNILMNCQTMISNPDNINIDVLKSCLQQIQESQELFAYYEHFKVDIDEINKTMKALLEKISSDIDGSIKEIQKIQLFKNSYTKLEQYQAILEFYPDFKKKKELIGNGFNKRFEDNKKKIFEKVSKVNIYSKEDLKDLSDWIIYLETAKLLPSEFKLDTASLDSELKNSIKLKTEELSKSLYENLKKIEDLICNYSKTDENAKPSKIKETIEQIKKSYEFFTFLQEKHTDLFNIMKSFGLKVDSQNFKNIDLYLKERLLNSPEFNLIGYMVAMKNLTKDLMVLDTFLASYNLKFGNYYHEAKKSLLSKVQGLYKSMEQDLLNDDIEEVTFKAKELKEESSEEILFYYKEFTKLLKKHYSKIANEIQKTLVLIGNDFDSEASKALYDLLSRLIHLVDLKEHMVNEGRSYFKDSFEKTVQDCMRKLKEYFRKFLEGLDKCLEGEEYKEYEKRYERIEKIFTLFNFIKEMKEAKEMKNLMDNREFEFGKIEDVKQVLQKYINKKAEEILKDEAYNTPKAKAFIEKVGKVLTKAQKNDLSKSMRISK